MVLNDLQTPEDSIILEEIVSPLDSYHRKNLVPIVGSPEKVSKFFGWRGNTIMSTENLKSQVGRFTGKHPELELDSDRILHTLAVATKEAEKDFKLIYKNQIDVPNYHYDRHAVMTAIEGVKIMLGGLAELYKNPKFKAFVDQNPGKMQQLVDIAIFAIARHEQDDWWNKRSVGAIAQKAVDPVWDSYQETVRQHIGNSCKLLGISKEDLNRLLILDTFTEELEVSVGRAMGPDRLKEPYFNDGSGVPEFAWLGKDPEIQKMFLTLLGESARAADFMQIFNPNYYRKAVLQGEDLPEEGFLSNVGAVALAMEYVNFRPGAAKFFGWLTESGAINWKVIGVGKKFIREFALKNIKLGVNYLKNFDEHEGGNGEKIVGILEDAVAVSVPIKVSL